MEEKEEDDEVEEDKVYTPWGLQSDTSFLTNIVYTLFLLLNFHFFDKGDDSTKAQQLDEGRQTMFNLDWNTLLIGAGSGLLLEFGGAFE